MAQLLFEDLFKVHYFLHYFISAYVKLQQRSGGTATVAYLSNSIAMSLRTPIVHALLPLHFHLHYLHETCRHMKYPPIQNAGTNKPGIFT